MSNMRTLAQSMRGFCLAHNNEGGEGGTWDNILWTDFCNKNTYTIHLLYPTSTCCILILVKNVEHVCSSLRNIHPSIRREREGRGVSPSHHPPLVTSEVEQLTSDLLLTMDGGQCAGCLYLWSWDWLELSRSQSDLVYVLPPAGISPCFSFSHQLIIADQLLHD